MKTQKILLKTAYCLVSLIILSSIGLNIFQYQRNKKLSENAAPEAVTQEESTDSQMTAPVKTLKENTTKSMGPPGKDPDMSYIRELEDQLNATEEQLDMLSAQLVEERAQKEEFKNADAKLQKNFLSNPTIKASMKNSLKQAIDRDYALLYERLELSPEELDEFKRIVMDWREANMDRAALMYEASTAEEKEEVYRLRQEARDKYNEEFIDLMGEEKFRIYDDFKNRNSERHYLNNFMETLSPEERIDDYQVEDLIDAMYEARKSVEIEMGLDDIIQFPSALDNETAAREMEMVAHVYEKYEEVGGYILPPDQAEQYKAFMRQQREMLESQLKMRLFLLGDKTDKKGDEEIY